MEFAHKVTPWLWQSEMAVTCGEAFVDVGGTVGLADAPPSNRNATRMLEAMLDIYRIKDRCAKQTNKPPYTPGYISFVGLITAGPLFVCGGVVSWLLRSSRLAQHGKISSC